MMIVRMRVIVTMMMMMMMVMLMTILRIGDGLTVERWLHRITILCHYGNFCLLGITPLFLWEFLFVRSLVMSTRLVLTAGYLLNSSTSKIIDGP